MVGRAVRLEAVDTDLGGCVQVPPRIGPEPLDVTVVAFRFAAEQSVSALRGVLVETAETDCD